MRLLWVSDQFLANTGLAFFALSGSMWFRRVSEEYLANPVVGLLHSQTVSDYLEYGGSALLIPSRHCCGLQKVHALAEYQISCWFHRGNRYAFQEKVSFDWVSKEDLLIFLPCRCTLREYVILPNIWWVQCWFSHCIVVPFRRCVMSSIIRGVPGNRPAALLCPQNVCHLVELPVCTFLIVSSSRCCAL